MLEEMLASLFVHAAILAACIIAVMLAVVGASISIVRIARIIWRAFRC